MVQCLPRTCVRATTTHTPQGNGEGLEDESPLSSAIDLRDDDVLALNRVEGERIHDFFMTFSKVIFRFRRFVFSPLRCFCLRITFAMIVWRVFLVVCMVGVLVLGPASAAYPVLSKGSSGDAVRVLQHLLNHWGSSLTVDGSFGTGVKNAVKALQSSKGLVVDGVVGTETWSNTHVTVSKTSTSSHAIRAVQQALRMHDIAVSVSGTFDTATDNGVRTFQRNEGLGVDGWVGKNTWRSLLDTSGGGSSEGVDDNIPIPSSINPRYSYARHSTMKSVFGTPGSLTTHCSSLTNRKLKRYMVTKNVGPFRVTGLKWAVEALARIFTKVKRDKLHVFNSLKSNGMLCCRAVRGSTKYFSNHSWGSALDLVVNGKTDPRGDGKCFRAILDLYPYFEAEKFYWGAGFSYEDAMHFEVSNELAKSWEDLYT